MSMKILIPLLIITNLITAFFAFDLNRKLLETDQIGRWGTSNRNKNHAELWVPASRVRIDERKLFEKEAELKAYLLEEVDHKIPNRE